MLIKKHYEIDILNPIGKGSFSSVYKAFNQKTKEIVAIKIIDKNLFNSSDYLKALIQTEISVLYSAKHDNIVNFKDYFETKNNCHLIMEYCETDLFKYLKNKQNNRLTEIEAKEFLRQILFGFQRLHELSVIHRDIKLENIFLKGNICKIGDLGFAKVVESNTLSKIGTDVTMAPEIIQGKPYNNLVDLWSVGIIYYQLVVGELPFNLNNAKSCVKALEFINNNPLVFPNDCNVSEHSKNLIGNMLKIEPGDRIKWSEVYNHKLFQKEEEFIDILSSKFFLKKNKSDEEFGKNSIFYEKFEKKNDFYQDENENLDKIIKENLNEDLFKEEKIEKNNEIIEKESKDEIVGNEDLENVQEKIIDRNNNENNINEKIIVSCKEIIIENDKEIIKEYNEKNNQIINDNKEINNEKYKNIDENNNENINEVNNKNFDENKNINENNNKNIDDNNNKYIDNNNNKYINEKIDVNINEKNNNNIEKKPEIDGNKKELENNSIFEEKNNINIKNSEKNPKKIYNFNESINQEEKKLPPKNSFEEILEKQNEYLKSNKKHDNFFTDLEFLQKKFESERSKYNYLKFIFQIFENSQDYELRFLLCKRIYLKITELDAMLNNEIGHVYLKMKYWNNFLETDIAKKLKNEFTNEANFVSFQLLEYIEFINNNMLPKVDLKPFINNKNYKNENFFNFEYVFSKVIALKTVKYSKISYQKGIALCDCITIENFAENFDFLGYISQIEKMKKEERKATFIRKYNELKIK